MRISDWSSDVCSSDLALGLARDLHAHPPRRHFLEQNAQLQLGEARADAAVNAVAEGQVAAGILAVKFQGVAIVEHALVAVRRNIPEDELVALFNLKIGRASCRARVCQSV